MRKDHKMNINVGKEVAALKRMTNKELLAIFQSLGFTDVRNHMSAVEPDAIERVRRKLERAV